MNQQQCSWYIIELHRQYHAHGTHVWHPVDAICAPSADAAIRQCEFQLPCKGSQQGFVESHTAVRVMDDESIEFAKQVYYQRRKEIDEAREMACRKVKPSPYETIHLCRARGIKMTIAAGGVILCGPKEVTDAMFEQVQSQCREIVKILGANR